MPLDSSDQRHLTAAEGFSALGMYEDANSELESIDALCRTLPEVLVVRLSIYQGTQRWEAMAAVAAKLVHDDCNNSWWWIAWVMPLVALNHWRRRVPFFNAEQRCIHKTLTCCSTSPVTKSNWATSTEERIISRARLALTPALSLLRSKILTSNRFGRSLLKE